MRRSTHFLIRAGGVAALLCAAGCAPPPPAYALVSGACQGVGANTGGGAVLGAMAGAAIADAGRHPGPGPQGIDPVSGAIIGGIAGGMIGNAIDNQGCVPRASYAASTEVVVGTPAPYYYAPAPYYYAPYYAPPPRPWGWGPRPGPWGWGERHGPEGWGPHGYR